MNRSYFKVVCSSLIFSIFSYLSLFGCRFENNPEFVTNPCIRLESPPEKSKFIILCTNSRIVVDAFGRAFPQPCQAIGKFAIVSDQSLREAESDTEGPIFAYFGHSIESWPNFYRMHAHVSPKGRTADQGSYSQSVLDVQGSNQEHFPGFEKTTEVLTEHGIPVQIGLLQVGDAVVSYDFESGSWSSAVIIEIKNKRVSGPCVKFGEGSNTVIAGPDQRFYLVQENKWSYAKELDDKSLLMERLDDKDNQFGLVCVDPMLCQIGLDGGPESLVCLTLDRHHNFCVGGGIVTHNCTHVFKNGIAVPVFCPKAQVNIGQDSKYGNFKHVVSCYGPDHAQQVSAFSGSGGVYKYRRESVVQYSGSRPGGDGLIPHYGRSIVEQDYDFSGPKNVSQSQVSKPLEMQVLDRAGVKDQWISGLKATSYASSRTSFSNGGISKKQAERMRECWSGYQKQLEDMAEKDHQIRLSRHRQAIEKAEADHKALVENAYRLKPQRDAEIIDTCKKYNKFVLENSFKERVKDLENVKTQYCKLAPIKAVDQLSTLVEKCKLNKAIANDPMALGELQLEVLEDVYQTLNHMGLSGQDKQFWKDCSNEMFLLSLGKALSKAFVINSIEKGELLANGCLSLLNSLLSSQAVCANMAPVTGFESLAGIERFVQTAITGFSSNELVASSHNRLFQMMGRYAIPLFLVAGLAGTMWNVAQSEGGRNFLKQTTDVLVGLKEFVKQSFSESAKFFGLNHKSFEQIEKELANNNVLPCLAGVPDFSEPKMGCGTSIQNKNDRKPMTCGSGSQKEIEPKSCGTGQIPYKKPSIGSCLPDDTLTEPVVNQPCLIYSGSPSAEDDEQEEGIGSDPESQGQALEVENLEDQTQPKTDSEESKANGDSKPSTEEQPQGSKGSQAKPKKAPASNYPIFKESPITRVTVPEKWDGFSDTWDNKIDFWKKMNKKFKDNSPEVLDQYDKIRDTVFEIEDVIIPIGKMKIELEKGAKKTYHHWKFKNAKARIYKAKEDIPSLGIKKGHYFYLDLTIGHYGDHIEVFDGNKNAYEVRNLDGTLDQLKTDVALNKVDEKGLPVRNPGSKIRNIREGGFVKNFCENFGCEDCIDGSAK